jgi:hypothetical protein
LHENDIIIFTFILFTLILRPSTTIITTTTNTNRLENYLYVNRIRYYDSQYYKGFTKLASEGFASVYAAKWKNTSSYAIKNFNETSKEEDIINEVCY